MTDWRTELQALVSSYDALFAAVEHSRAAIAADRAHFAHRSAPVAAEGEAELALKELERTVVLLMPVTGHKKIKRFDTIRAALKRLQELENNADLSPAPAPAEGEVGVLVADLQMMASQAVKAWQYNDAESLSRTADLLLQQEGRIARAYQEGRRDAEADAQQAAESAEDEPNGLEQRHPAPAPAAEGEVQ